jgi:hypothetical protein
METNIDDDNKFSKFLKLLKIFIKQFVIFFSLRGLLSLMKYLILEKGYTKINFQKLFKIFFNISHVRTGLFLSLIPFIYEFIQLYNNDSKIITFIAGFISGLVGIIISEKANILNFIVLSIFLRSIHSLIVVWLRLNDYRSQNRLVSYVLFVIACFIFLFIAYFHPTYSQVNKLFVGYANLSGNEKQEFNDIIKKINLVS